MTSIPTIIPSSIPTISTVVPPTTGTADNFSPYDIAIGGNGFFFSNTPDSPMVRETVQLEKERIDQANSPGEQTLTSWWIRSQASFHGGAGQLNLETEFPAPTDKIRFAASKGVDVFTPGTVSRLPDSILVASDSASAMLGVAIAGADALAYLTTGGVVKLITSLLSSPTTTSFTGGTSVTSIATDGVFVYASTATTVLKLNPAAPASAAVTVASFTSASGAVLGWTKSRLMLGVAGAVYELDVSQTGVTLGSTQLRYQHPTPGFQWRCFGASPTAVLAAGDATGQSTITPFAVVNVSGAPALQVQGDVAPMPVGERVISLASSQGTFLIIGTTRGVRIGTYNTYTGALTYGPLELLPTDPTIPANALTCRDRFVYVAGAAYDEGGLLVVDLGTQVDQAGRYAWSAGLIPPTATQAAATAVVTLPVSGSLAYSIPGTGILVEGAGAGSVREAWLQTSRIRFDTTEPKLFKLMRVRGNLTAGAITISASNTFSTQPVQTVGFTVTDPQELRLPTGLSEWLQLQLTLVGSTSTLSSYQVKALPGSRRQRHYQYVLSCNSNETSRQSQRVREPLSARERLAALEELAAAGDEVTLQEFAPDQVYSTLVVVESVSFKQTGRPTAREDLGGDVTVLLRTVES